MLLLGWLFNGLSHSMALLLADKMSSSPLADEPVRPALCRHKAYRMGTKKVNGRLAALGVLLWRPAKQQQHSQQSHICSTAGYLQCKVVAKNLDRRQRRKASCCGARQARCSQHCHVLLICGRLRAVQRGGRGAGPAPGTLVAHAGYEAALDAWLPRLWVALRASAPLPPVAPEARAHLCRGCAFAMQATSLCNPGACWFCHCSFPLKRNP